MCLDGQGSAYAVGKVKLAGHRHQPQRSQLSHLLLATPVLKQRPASPQIRETINKLDLPRLIKVQLVHKKVLRPNQQELLRMDLAKVIHKDYEPPQIVGVHLLLEHSSRLHDRGAADPDPLLASD